MRKLGCLLLILISIHAKSQNFFIKSYQPLISNPHFLEFSEQEFIVAGIQIDATVPSKSNLLIHMLDKCGNIIWNKELSAPSPVSLDIRDIERTEDNAFLIAGNYQTLSGRKMYLLKMDSDGMLENFKVFETGTSDIAYSMDVNSQGEIFLFLNKNIGEAGPHSRMLNIKLNSDLSIKWVKQFNFFSWIWGEMAATSDGGLIVSNNIEACKFDSLGNPEWTIDFNASGYSQNHFEVPTGYVFFRYDNIPSYAFPFMLNKDGSVKWIGQRIEGFRPYNGILRANGNLLFVGRLSRPDLVGGKTVFMELDTSNGNIINTSIPFYDKQGLMFNGLSEHEDGSLFFSGIENLSLTGGMVFGRINDTLGSGSCNDTLIKFNSPLATLNLTSISNWQVTNSNISIVEPIITLINHSLNAPFTICSYSSPIEIELGNDTSLCEGEVLQLDPGTQLFDSYLWSTGETTKSIKVDSEGSYWVKVVLDCDTTSDTIQVSYIEKKPVQLGEDTTLCPANTLLLDAHLPNASYLWQDHSTNATFTLDKAGTYWVQRSLNGCTSIDTIVVDYYAFPLVDLGADTVLCHGGSLLLSIDPSYEYIEWSTGEKQHQVTIEESGVYSVAYGNFCDTLMDTIKVDFYPETQIEVLVDPKEAKVSEFFDFMLIKPDEFHSLQWYFGDGFTSMNNPSKHSYSSSGEYTVLLEMTDSNLCVQSFQVDLTVKEHTFVIPNIFTPNADGINDIFTVFGEKISELSIDVYNRWGEKIFHSNSHWEGRGSSGTQVPNGVYFYNLQFKQAGKNVQRAQGEVQLLR